MFKTKIGKVKSLLEEMEDEELKEIKTLVTALLGYTEVYFVSFVAYDTHDKRIANGSYTIPVTTKDVEIMEYTLKYAQDRSTQVTYVHVLSMSNVKLYN